MILSTFVSSVNCSPWILSFSLSKNSLTLIQAPAWIAKEAWRRLSSQLEPQDSCPQSRSPEKWWSVAPFHTSQGHGILAPWCGRLMTRGAPTPSSTCVCVCGGGLSIHYRAKLQQIHSLSSKCNWGILWTVLLWLFSRHNSWNHYQYFFFSIPLPKVTLCYIFEQMNKHLYSKQSAR